MASLKEKLAALGAPVRELTLTSRDGTQELTIWYKRPTLFKDRILRELMRQEYDEAVKEFKKKDESGDSKAQRFTKEFVALGLDKCARFVVNSDLREIRADSIRSLGKEEPTDNSSPEHDAWFAELKPILEENIKNAVEAMKELGIELLADKAVEIQLDTIAKEKSYDVYRMNLILDSIHDKQEDGKLLPAFDTRDEIEKYLVPDIIEDLSTMIAEEVRKAREIPLKSVATS